MKAKRQEEIPITEPVKAWRVAFVADGRLHDPVGGDQTPTTNQARCNLGSHPSPDPHCRCGIHAATVASDLGELFDAWSKKMQRQNKVDANGGPFGINAMFWRDDDPRRDAGRVLRYLVDHRGMAIARVRISPPVFGGSRTIRDDPPSTVRGSGSEILRVYVDNPAFVPQIRGHYHRAFPVTVTRLPLEEALASNDFRPVK